MEQYIPVYFRQIIKHKVRKYSSVLRYRYRYLMANVVAGPDPSESRSDHKFAHKVVK